jgi:peptidoglycan hydrolase-like protein with peptidoglycan-binding domain
VTAGTRIVVEAIVRRPGWVGWIAGRQQRLKLQLVAPLTRPTQRWLRVRSGAPLRVTFSKPVRELRVSASGRPAVRRLTRPARTVALGRVPPAGSIAVSAVARPWELLPPPTTVTWFPPGRAPKVLVTPRPGSLPATTTPLRLRFSEPVSLLLHNHAPKLVPATPGAWRTLDSHTLEFVPRGYGFGLDTPVRLILPSPVERVSGGRSTTTRTIAWRTPPGSEVRLQQLLAELGYLPVSWTAAHEDAARTIAAQSRAAVQPPAGSFGWRYPNIPSELSSLWIEGQPNQIVRGAVMTFQDTHDLTVDGFAGRDVWRALIADVIAGRGRGVDYSYVYVHRSVPQSLNLWHAGQVILSSPGNTGVPAAPTQLGTFPVFEHIPVGTMSGTNPDGSHYNDPGIRYISYFNGGDAIHSFNRSSFGTPQSLGCVELPLAAAATVWPYTPIGTLVTIEN